VINSLKYLFVLFLRYSFVGLGLQLLIRLTAVQAGGQSWISEYGAN